MRQFKWLFILMSFTLLAIIGFQVYWLKDSYAREKQNLDIKASAAFRQTILNLQASKLKLANVKIPVDSVFISKPQNGSANKKKNSVITMRSVKSESPITIANLVQEKLRDSLGNNKPGNAVIFITLRSDSATHKITDSTRGTKSRILIKSKNGLPFDIPLDSIDPSQIKEIRVIGKGAIKRDSSSSDSFRASRIFDNISVTSERPIKNVSNNFNKSNSLIKPLNKPTEKNYNIIYNIDPFQDSLKISEIDTAFMARLKDDKINVLFSVNRLDSVPAAQNSSANEIVIGFGKPVAYKYSLLNSFPFIIKQIKLPIIFSIFLVGITMLSFWLLYRNVLRQQKLGAIKNEFINNITHELKTPIATVSVAIEALKNFNAIKNPERTKEYLDISSNEMQRLSMLVDKVLTLSVFEKNKLELKYEMIQLKEVAEEVAASLRPQLEKYHATLQIQGNAALQADRLHLVSVVFNLVDNAIKYSKNGCAINIELKENEKEVLLIVADNGIGIPAEYKYKIFETFFRVPHGDTHNAKGHGLGLSYVASVVEQHHGMIKVESKVNEGTTFVITFPKQMK